MFAIDKTLINGTFVDHEHKVRHKIRIKNDHTCKLPTHVIA